MRSDTYSFIALLTLLSLLSISFVAAGPSVVLNEQKDSVVVYQKGGSAGYSPTPVTLQSGWNSFGINFNSTYQYANGTNVTIPLLRGFNLIGYSSYTSINVNDILFSVGANTYTYSQAQTSLNLTINSSVGQSRGATPTTLEANKAYWLSVNQSCNVTFPNVGGSQVGTNYSYYNLIFWNGTISYNITDATNAGWITSDIFYWNTNYSFRGVKGRYENLFGNFDNVISWQGYLINAKVNNLQLIIQEQWQNATKEVKQNNHKNKIKQKINIGNIRKDYIEDVASYNTEKIIIKLPNTK